MSETKVLMVSGVGGLLGQAFATVFGRAGYAVAGLDIDQAALQRFSSKAEAAGTPHLAKACDVRDWGQIAEAVDAVADRFGRIDVVINNAVGRTTPHFKSLEDVTAEDVDRVLAIGPRGVIGVMRTALPHLKKVQGCVINIGSGTGVRPLVGISTYATAKGAIHTLTCAAAQEWGPYGVRVNGIMPFVMSEELIAEPERIKAVAPVLGRVGDPETDLATVALFLASPGGGYITGQNIPVNGGHLMR
jgi:NAD(P)-dependent dehydrogenase (short-subunit alcohol dehydrogenase family)